MRKVDEIVVAATMEEMQFIDASNRLQYISDDSITIMGL